MDKTEPPQYQYSSHVAEAVLAPPNPQPPTPPQVLCPLVTRVYQSIVALQCGGVLMEAHCPLPLWQCAARVSLPSAPGSVAV